jgi:hypothetical protein
MESGTVAGDSPVRDDKSSLEVYPSKTSHVEPGLNQGGPSPKAKYSLATDSELVARAKDGKNPC